MNRLLATLGCDLRLQARNGFYAATAAVTAFWALLLPQVQSFDWSWLLPPMVVGNLLLSTFYFIGGLVLLERDEGTLAAQVVTPLRIGEYLAAKVCTLSALSLAETLVVVVLMRGWRVDWLPLMLATVLASALYCLVGFVAVARYQSINAYLLPSTLYATALWLPLLAYMAQWSHWLLYLHPLQAALVLAQAAFAPMNMWLLLYSVGYGALWVGLLAWLSRRAFCRWMVTN